MGKSERKSGGKWSCREKAIERCEQYYYEYELKKGKVTVIIKDIE